MILHKRYFYTSKIYSKIRLDPYKNGLISVLVGALLGDTHAEKRKNSTRFIVHVSNKNIEYLYSLHKFFYKNGYCSTKKPSISRRVGKNNNVYFSIRFKTFSLKSLNFLYELFYNESNKKIVPLYIQKFLTAQAFTVWFLSHGIRSGSGLKVFTDNFSYQDLLYLQKAIHDNFKILPAIQPHKIGYVIYFKKENKQDENANKRYSIKDGKKNTFKTTNFQYK